MLNKSLTACWLIAATLLVVGLLVSNTVKAVQEDSNLFGDWTSESICQVRNSPCRDEKVVYHLSVGRRANLVNISADKIVDGRAVNMGEMEFKYDKVAGSLVNDDHGRWKLIIKGKRMEGTLTLADGRLYRKDENTDTDAQDESAQTKGDSRGDGDRGAWTKPANAQG